MSCAPKRKHTRFSDSDSEEDSSSTTSPRSIASTSSDPPSTTNTTSVQHPCACVPSKPHRSRCKRRRVSQRYSDQSRLHPHQQQQRHRSVSPSVLVASGSDSNRKRRNSCPDDNTNTNTATTAPQSGTKNDSRSPKFKFSHQNSFPPHTTKPPPPPPTTKSQDDMDDGGEVSTMCSWLCSLNINAKDAAVYSKHLVSNGYDSLDSLCLVDVHEWEQFGVKQGHAKRIIKSVLLMSHVTPAPTVTAHSNPPTTSAPPTAWPPLQLPTSPIPIVCSSCSQHLGDVKTVATSPVLLHHHHMPKARLDVCPQFRGKHVMISYEWGSQLLAEEIFNHLHTSLGLPVWMDVHGRMFGNINRAMAEGVEGAGVVIPLLTPKYQASHNCEKELSYASERKALIVPVMAATSEERKQWQPSSWLGAIIAAKLYISMTGWQTANSSNGAPSTAAQQANGNNNNNSPVNTAVVSKGVDSLVEQLKLIGFAM